MDDQEPSLLRTIILVIYAIAIILFIPVILPVLALSTPLRRVRLILRGSCKSTQSGA